MWGGVVNAFCSHDRVSYLQHNAVGVFTGYEVSFALKSAYMSAGSPLGMHLVVHRILES